MTIATKTEECPKIKRKPVEIVADMTKIKEAMKANLRRRTVRVKSVLP